MHQQKLVPSQGSSTDYLCRHEAVRGHAQRFLRGANSKRLELGAQHSPPVRRTQNPVLARSIINGLARRRVRAGRSSVLGITGENCFRPGELARASAACAGEGAQVALPCGPAQEKALRLHYPAGGGRLRPANPTPLPRLQVCSSTATDVACGRVGQIAACGGGGSPPTTDARLAGRLAPSPWRARLPARPTQHTAWPRHQAAPPRFASLACGQSCPAQIRHATSSTTPCELLPPAVAGSAFFDR
jgi:hypothetical protein